MFTSHRKWAMKHRKSHWPEKESLWDDAVNYDSPLSGFKHVYMKACIRVPTWGKGGRLLLVCLHSN